MFSNVCFRVVPCSPETSSLLWRSNRHATRRSPRAAQENWGDGLSRRAEGDNRFKVLAVWDKTSLKSIYFLGLVEDLSGFDMLLMACCAGLVRFQDKCFLNFSKSMFWGAWATWSFTIYRKSYWFSFWVCCSPSQLGASISCVIPVVRDGFWSL